jgi:hypothetical protein
LLPHDEVNFAHNTERQFAKLLDFYQIDWMYEPTTFDIAWDRDGKPTQRFSPDFYLPLFDVYIEITTLNQKLVTKKNRKIRRLTALYPDVQCKILYQRDYLNLLVKYGLEPPQDVEGNSQSPEEPPSGADLPPPVGSILSSDRPDSSTAGSDLQRPVGPILAG